MNQWKGIVPHKLFMILDARPRNDAKLACWTSTCCKANLNVLDLEFEVCWKGTLAYARCDPA